MNEGATFRDYIISLAPASTLFLNQLMTQLSYCPFGIRFLVYHHNEPIIMVPRFKVDADDCCCCSYYICLLSKEIV
jgi:hypothetical protein